MANPVPRGAQVSPAPRGDAMAKRSASWVITSNHLLEGDAIWLDADGDWTRNLADAHLFDDKSGAEAGLAAADKQRHLHVGAYLADADAGPDGRPRPTHYRERFRTRGPSNYFHGKQAEG